MKKNEVKEKMYLVMKKAIANKNKVKIKYKSVNSGITERIIHPAELFIYLDKWYIFIPYGYDKTLAQMSDDERKNRKK